MLFSDMIYIRPDYYDAFHCTADRCRHSCCVGWEIDIDAESLDFFKGVSGSLGEKLRCSIDTENEPHFILDKNERCPFLTENGLCELIIALGEDSLCDICTEHPRFYNSYPERFEMGLGACCEEAARLITEGKESVRLLCESDEESERNTPAIFVLRDELFQRLSVASLSLPHRIRSAASLFDLSFGNFNAAETVAFYDTLERMDEEWTDCLKLLEAFNDFDVLYQALDTIRYERITEYFLYRHFAEAVDEEDAAARFAFAILSTEIICALELSGHADALRLYSSEIEYSDENVDLILDAIKDGKLSM